MPRRARWYPNAASFATPARVQLASVTRRFVDAILTVPADETQLTTTTAQLEAMVAALEAGAPQAAEDNHSMERTHDDYLPRSPFVGAINVVAPPFAWEQRDGRLHSHGEFTAAHEGPPGYVHGGWVALAFDEALGITNVASGNPAMTARLTIRYRRPTPLYVDLVLEAWVDRVEGRRIHAVGRILDGETITAEAEGTFVNIGAERALEYFGERPATPEPTDPLP